MAKNLTRDPADPNRAARADRMALFAAAGRLVLSLPSPQQRLRDRPAAVPWPLIEAIELALIECGADLETARKIMAAELAKEKNGHG